MTTGSINAPEARSFTSAALRRTTEGRSGASLIGASPIPGLDGIETTQDALEALAVSVADAGDHSHPLATDSADGFFSAQEKTKLSGIEVGATADMTAIEIRAALLTVDGAGTGIDADLLDGLDSTAFLRRSGGTMTGDIVLRGDPIQALHPATKAYADALASGLDHKQSVRLSASTNITSSGAQTIDSVAAANGDRVLLFGQTDSTQNGIWAVNTAGAWTRPPDYQTGAVSSGVFVFVEEGTLRGDCGFTLTTNGAITVGTTQTAWSQFSGPGSVVAGTGLSRTGNIFSVASQGIVASMVSDALRDAAAATASLRTLGTGAQQAASGNHGHASATAQAAGFESAAHYSRTEQLSDAYVLGLNNLPTNSKNADASITTYPLGISVVVAGSTTTGWPLLGGTVQTYKSAPSRATQYFVSGGTNSITFVRSWSGPEVDGMWATWNNVQAATPFSIHHSNSGGQNSSVGGTLPSKVWFATENYDMDSRITLGVNMTNALQSRFVARVPGVMAFTAGTGFTAPSSLPSAVHYAQLYLRHTAQPQGVVTDHLIGEERFRTPGERVFARGSKRLMLAASDEVEVHMTQDSGQSVALIATKDYTFFEGDFVGV